MGVNAETGVMELKPVSDDRITRTETSQVKIEALKITYEELRSGAYESMYAGLYSQVYVPEGGSLGDLTLKDNLSMQDPDNNRFRLVALVHKSASDCPMSSRSTPPRRPTRIVSM